eukprot:m.92774 g.92774  ORF g.92774 m.92774 type:complete len:1031 (-) comp8522_c0_seq1:159-3251(-)
MERRTDAAQRYLAMLLEDRVACFRNIVGGWIADVLGIQLDRKQLNAQLESGVVLCLCARSLQPRGAEPIEFDESARRGTAAARANIAAFLQAARDAGVPSRALFKVADVTERQGDMRILQCLLELARRGPVRRLPTLLVREKAILDGGRDAPTITAAALRSAVQAASTRMSLRRVPAVQPAERPGYYTVDGSGPYPLTLVDDYLLVLDDGHWDTFEHFVFQREQRQPLRTRQENVSAAVAAARSKDTAPGLTGPSTVTRRVESHDIRTQVATQSAPVMSSMATPPAPLTRAVTIPTPVAVPVQIVSQETVSTTTAAAATPAVRAQPPETPAQTSKLSTQTRISVTRSSESVSKDSKATAVGAHSSDPMIEALRHEVQRLQRELLASEAQSERIGRELQARLLDATSKEDALAREFLALQQAFRELQALVRGHVEGHLDAHIASHHSAHTVEAEHAAAHTHTGHHDAGAESRDAYPAATQHGPSDGLSTAHHAAVAASNTITTTTTTIRTEIRDDTRTRSLHDGDGDAAPVEAADDAGGLQCPKHHCPTIVIAGTTHAKCEAEDTKLHLDIRALRDEIADWSQRHALVVAEYEQTIANLTTTAMRKHLQLDTTRDESSRRARQANVTMNTALEDQRDRLTHGFEEERADARRAVSDAVRMKDDAIHDRERELQDQIAFKEKQMALKDQQISNLELQLETIGARVESGARGLQGQVEALQHAVADRETANGTLVEHMKQQQQQYEATIRRLEAAHEDNVARALSDQRRLSSDLQHNRESEIADMHRMYRAQIADSETRVQHIEARMQHLQAAHDTAMQELRFAHAQQINDLNLALAKEVQAALHQLEDAKADKAAQLQAQAARHRAEMDRMRKEHDGLAAHMHAEVTALRAQCSTLEADLREQYDVRHMEVPAIGGTSDARVQQLSQQLQDALEDRERLESELSTFKARFTDLEAAIQLHLADQEHRQAAAQQQYEQARDAYEARIAELQTRLGEKPTPMPRPAVPQTTAQVAGHPARISTSALRRWSLQEY